jgi:glutamate-ammonia-ligase adenylyltransferase
MSLTPNETLSEHAYELPVPKQLVSIYEERRYWLQQFPAYQDAMHGHLGVALTLSDFLYDSARFCPELFEQHILCWDNHQEFHQSDLLSWQSFCNQADTEEDWHHRLRQWRKVCQWRIIIRDALGLATLDETFDAVSTLAQKQIQTTLAWIEPQQREKWGTPVTESGEPMSLIVLGMGKLGAGELNLSSDIDLIFAYPEAGQLPGKKGRSYQEFFERVGQKCIQALDKIIAGDHVFRVDMRLRPYGQSGPLVMSFQAMEVYYRDQGREWERFAMTRVAQVGGSLQQGAPLLKMLKAFTYRRYLDYGVIDALRTMKRQIEAEGRRTDIGELHLKLGPGGIREAEFIAQALQLIRGGQDPRLQEPAFIPLMQLIASEALLPKAVCDDLTAAYKLFRRTEHALQAFRDEQTQRLPNTLKDQERLAWYLGYPSWDAFQPVLNHLRDQVNLHFKAFIKPPPDIEESETLSPWIALWQAKEEVVDHSLTPQLDQLRSSHSIVKMRARSRDRLDHFMPLLLDAVDSTASDDKAKSALLARLIPLVEAIARRSAYLVLLVENPIALQLLVRLSQASTWVAATLAKHPMLLDELLDPDYLYESASKADLASELNQRLLRIPTEDLELSMDALRHFVQAHQFHAAASEVMNKLPLMKVSDYLTWLAEVVLERTLELAWQQLINKFGFPSNEQGEAVNAPEFLILGYGKLGGLEMGYASDLDLVFLQDAKPGHTLGERSIDNGLFYTRLGQRIVHILTTATAAGSLYETDLRLRPSGASGMIVASIAGFIRYQTSDAWTWEHQALVRARPITGDASIAKKIETARINVLSMKRDVEKLREEVAAMRLKMRHNLGPKVPGDDHQFDVKRDSGGLIDIEFIVQFGALAWSNHNPGSIQYTDNMRLLDAYRDTGWMSAEDTQALQQAYLCYRALIHRQALQNLPAIVSLTDPDSDINMCRQQVSAIWQRYIKAMH